MAARLQTEAAPGARARGGRARAPQSATANQRGPGTAGARARGCCCGCSTRPRRGLGSFGRAAPGKVEQATRRGRAHRLGMGVGAEEGEKGERKGTPARVEMAVKETRAIPNQRGAYSRNFLET